ncbi:hypothetical protein SAMN05444673_3710 [Bacillus sp. OV166]|nr:hypothetical protein SAMN05444673_3710 [Bacillus sp. OV166]
MSELIKRNLSVIDISYAVVGTGGNVYIDIKNEQK